MADRWLYKHAGAVHGPVARAKLEQLATIGAVLPTDEIWLEGEDPRRAVEAISILEVESFGSLLAQVDQALATPPAAPGATPDWLTDVQSASAEPAPAAPTPPASTTPDRLRDGKKSPGKPAPKAQPTAPMAAKPKHARPGAPEPESTDVELVEEEEAEEPAFEFTRRDLLMFVLGAVSVALAVGSGFYLANRPWGRKNEDDPPVDKEAAQKQ